MSLDNETVIRKTKKSYSGKRVKCQEKDNYGAGKNKQRPGEENRNCRVQTVGALLLVAAALSLSQRSFGGNVLASRNHNRKVLREAILLQKKMRFEEEQGQRKEQEQKHQHHQQQDKRKHANKSEYKHKNHKKRYKHGLREKIPKLNKNEFRFINPRLLPLLPEQQKSGEEEPYSGKGLDSFGSLSDDEWLTVSENLFSNNSDYGDHHKGPKVDYTKHPYQYPDIEYEPINDGSYPRLESMATIFEVWGQDDLDNPPETIIEVLQHFDYQVPEQMEAAAKYRNLELPFKVYNVPDIDAASIKWTDDYISSNFRSSKRNRNNEKKGALPLPPPPSSHSCTQSIDSFFGYYNPEKWDPNLLGQPPSTVVDWDFETWSKHAVYADAVGLPIHAKHYYFDCGAHKEERFLPYDQWSFVSRDLPSFSSPKPNFFGFDPSKQKGIDCRFGERGVTTATHYDGGRNMVAMITGAKRYVLSPPNACGKLAVMTSRHHPSYRQSMLNFGRIALLSNDVDGKTEMNEANDGDISNIRGVKMSQREKKWLGIAADAPSVSTVVKAGEVLYVPSHWFHYIVSLQKSAQCNTRSGKLDEGNPHFGGLRDVEVCGGATVSTE